MSQIELPATRVARKYLSFCYRHGLIGCYRRLPSAWLIRHEARNLTLDDQELVAYLSPRIAASPDLAEEFDIKNLD